MGGNRENFSSYVIKENDVRHEDIFLQTSYVAENNCVWLSAALVINSTNPTFARKMIEQMKVDVASYDWLSFIPNKHVERKKH